MEDDFLQQYRKDWDSLSDEQKFVVKQVRAGRNILNTGPGGTGKSFVIHFLGKYILNRMVDHIVAFMGTVAVQIKGATIHGFFKINPNVHSPERVVKTLTPDIRQKIRTMSSLRIDEVGQVSAELFDMVEQICRMVRNKPDLPAGGIQFVTFGDFLQLPPVNDHDKLVFTSNAWQRMSFVTVELTKVFRQSQVNFVRILHQLRVGQYDEELEQMLQKRIVRPGWKPDPDKPEPVRLYGRKDIVAENNQKRIAQLKGCRYVYEAHDVLAPGCPYSTESVLRDSPAAKTLTLKMGASVLLIRNLDVANGLANGTRGIVVGMKAADDQGMPVEKESKSPDETIHSDDSPETGGKDAANGKDTDNTGTDRKRKLESDESAEKGPEPKRTPLVEEEAKEERDEIKVRIDQDEDDTTLYPLIRFENGVERLIVPVKFDKEESHTLLASRVQVPLVLAYALTVHRAQGMTLESIYVHIPSMFATGHLYVALSRVRTLEGLFIDPDFNPIMLRSRIKTSIESLRFYQRMESPFVAKVAGMIKQTEESEAAREEDELDMFTAFAK